MYFRYKVNWQYDKEEKDETGLVYVNTKAYSDEGYRKAMDKICEYFDQINKVELETFAPDGCLEVSTTALDEIAKNVIW